MRRILDIAIYPIHWFAERVYAHCKPKVRRKIKVMIGLGIMLCGSFMSSLHQTIMPHFVWDMFAWGLHGYGALPFVRGLCKVVDLEDLEA